MREPHKRERFGFAFTTSLPIHLGKSAEFDQSRLRRMKLQPERRESIPKLRPVQSNLKSASVQQPLFMEPLPFPLSSRAKPRDLQFRGLLLETLNTILKQNCHLDRTRISCHAALETTTCAAFSKESRMKCANATKFHRKSGVAK